ncbi:MAG: hypothetical protein H7831_05365 [Magnetococcus sp. WYHC-3]
MPTPETPSAPAGVPPRPALTSRPSEPGHPERLHLDPWGSRTVLRAAAAVAVVLVVFLAWWSGLVAFLVNASTQRIDRVEAEQRAISATLDRADAKQAMALEQVEKNLADRITSLERDLTQRFTQELEKLQQASQSLDAKLEPYAWLQDHPQNSALAGQNPQSMGQVHDMVTALAESGQTSQATELTRRALDQQLTGSPVDFFNLSSQLGRMNLEALALEVCEAGLKKATQDADLLSHALTYATKIGAWDKAESFHQRLLALPRQRWGWRAFVFVGDYLDALGRIDEALAINAQFAQQLPLDERAYAQSAIIYSRLGQHDKVIEVARAGMDKVPMAAQLGLLLAKSLAATGQFQEVIRVTSRGLAGAAEVQPSAEQGAMLWERAAAYDVLTIQALDAFDANPTPGQWAQVESLFNKARVNYKSSGKVFRNSLHAQQAERRISILAGLLEERSVDMAQEDATDAEDAPSDTDPFSTDPSPESSTPGTPDSSPGDAEKTSSPSADTDSESSAVNDQVIEHMFTMLSALNAKDRGTLLESLLEQLKDLHQRLETGYTPTQTLDPLEAVRESLNALPDFLALGVAGMVIEKLE